MLKDVDRLFVFNRSSSLTVQNLRTQLVKIDHVCFGYLATTILLSVYMLLSITHKNVHCSKTQRASIKINVFTSG